MRDMLHLPLHFLTLSLALGEKTVTKYGTEIVYVCSPDQQPGLFSSIPPFANASVPMIDSSLTSSTPEATSTPAHEADSNGIVDVRIFNDFDGGELMIEYVFDCRVKDCSGLSSSDSSSPYVTVDAGNETLDDALVIGRRSDNENAYKRSNLKSMRDELDHTSKSDSDLVRINDLMKNATFLGALSVYEDIARSVKIKDDRYSNLKRCVDIWQSMWHKYWENNNGKDNNEIRMSKDAGSILLILTPSYYNIQTQDYEDARVYLGNRFNETNPAEGTDIQSSMTWMSDDEVDFIKQLVAYDATKRTEYITFLLNLYYKYGEAFSCDDGDSDCRISEGYGAAVDKSYKGDRELLAEDVGAAAAGMASIFAAAIPLAAYYAQFTISAEVAAASVPLAPDDMKSQADKKDHSTITETASSSITSTELGCDATYTDEDEDMKSASKEDSMFMNDEATTMDPDNVLNARAAKPTGPVKFEARKFSKMCKGAKNEKKCKNILKQHQVKFDINKVSYSGGNKDIYKKKFYLYDVDGKKKGVKESDRLPIYVVNAAGQSPGVACNALKFIATNYENALYFRGFKSSDDAEELMNHESKGGMLTLLYGVAAFTRGRVKGSHTCSGLSYNKYDWAKINPGGNKYYGSSFQLDEFPPFSANLVVQNLEHIAVTCVPDYDNQRDGTALGRFYGDQPSRDDIGTRKRKFDQCEELPSFSRAIDFSHFMPWTVDTDERDGPSKKMDLGKFIEVKEDQATTNKYGSSAFMVVVNTKDYRGKDIDCEAYEYGSDFTFQYKATNGEEY